MKKIPLMLLLVGIIAVGLIYIFPSVGGVIVEECEENEECAWVSTNCCPPNMGANWECVNEAETEIVCPEDPICPAVMSPMPEEECGCVDGTCLVIG